MEGKVLLGMAVSLTASIFLNMAMSFNVFALPIKETFNYTQTEVETVSSVGAVGVVLASSEALVTGKMGYLFSYGVTCVLSPLSALALYFAILNSHFFTDWPSLIGMLFFVTNASNNFMVLCVLNIGVNNFSQKHSAKIFGLYYALGGSGKIFFAAIYEIFFPGDLAHFMLTIGIIWVVLCVLCILFHRPRLLEPDQDGLIQHNEKATEYKTVSVSEKNDFETRERSSVRIKEMVRSRFAHLIFWPSVVFYACAFTTLNNITTIGQSSMMAHPLALVYVTSAMIVSSRFLLGFLLDRVEMVTRLTLCVICTSVFASGLIAVLSIFNIYTVWYLTVCIGIGIGSGLTLPNSLLVKEFGRESCSVITGCFLVIGFTLTFICQTCVGLVYDYNVKLSSNLYCYGAVCFRNSFLVLLICVGSVALVQCLNIYLYVTKNNRQNCPDLS